MTQSPFAIRQLARLRSSTLSRWIGLFLLCSVVAGQAMALEHVHSEADQSPSCSICAQADNVPLAAATAHAAAASFGKRPDGIPARVLATQAAVLSPYCSRAPPQH